MTRSKKVIAALAAVALLVLTWAAVLIVGLFFKPSLAVWFGIVTAAAIATEVALWVGAAIAGIALFQHIRNWVSVAPNTRSSKRRV
jgi:hypothetical protein